MPKALCKENLCFVLFFTICFSNFRQKDYSKAIIGREILLFRLWGFDGIKPYVIIYKTNHGPALQSLGVKGVYEFPEMFNVPKNNQTQNVLHDCNFGIYSLKEKHQSFRNNSTQQMFNTSSLEIFGQDPKTKYSFL